MRLQELPPQMSSLPQSTGIWLAMMNCARAAPLRLSPSGELDRSGKAAQVVDAIQDIRILNEGGLAFYGFGVHLC